MEYYSKLIANTGRHLPSDWYGRCESTAPPQVVHCARPWTRESRFGGDAVCRGSPGRGRRSACYDVVHPPSAYMCTYYSQPLITPMEVDAALYMNMRRACLLFLFFEYVLGLLIDWVAWPRNQYDLGISTFIWLCSLEVSSFRILCILVK